MTMLNFSPQRHRGTENIDKHRGNFCHPLLAFALFFLAGCAVTPELPPPEPVVPPKVQVPALPALTPVTWDTVSGWPDDDPAAAWPAFMQSCATLKNKPNWQAVCKAAVAIPAQDSAAQRTFFEENFLPYQVSNPDGSNQGLITGYYEPLLRGAKQRSAKYRYPLYGMPDDLLIIDLASVYPELKSMRLRGRLQGNRVVPYFSRAEIEHGDAPVKGKELFWVDDPIELFFLQIQGSGKIRLDSGETLSIGYAEQNGYPYKSIGKLLVERGELTLEKASLQGISNWAKQNPDKVRKLLDENASYVFFRELPNNLTGPLGALGVPLTAGRSIAIDPRTTPLGAPVFLATTWPNTERPLNRLMVAQDTGGAIRGAVRADFFWGFGSEAGGFAGSMRQRGKMWVLWPKDVPLPQNGTP
jgi:membrane-bound lytic murein transglycosylase A